LSSGENLDVSATDVYYQHLHGVRFRMQELATPL
jgi:hypothetical protein